MPKKVLHIFIGMILYCIAHPSFALEANDGKIEIGAVLIFRDEAPWLKEWLEYYKLLGVKHFYFYNHLSQDDYYQELAPYLASKEAELIQWTYPIQDIGEWIKVQIAAYNDALDRARGHVKWLCVVDADEFLVPAKEESLTALLAAFEGDIKCGGIQARWVNFGTSFVAKIPKDKLMIETLILNAGGADSLFKSIVRPERVVRFENPHEAIYKEGYKAIMMDADDIQTNHYWSRDEDYLYNCKVNRRALMGFPRSACIEYAIHQFNNDNPTFGSKILRFVPALKKNMGLSK